MKREYIFLTLFVIAVGVIFYQNIFETTGLDTAHNHTATEQYTCGMHPDIISEEPGNCPICEMKLTPLNKKSSSDEKIILHWRAPMDANEIYNSPGKSKMGMDLVPVYASQSDGIVNIDPDVVQNMNVKTEQVKKINFSTSFKTQGTANYSESLQRVVTTRASGWIEKLLVTYEGQSIKKGQPLLKLYSPKFISAQKEFLSSFNFKNELVSSTTSILNSTSKSFYKSSKEKLLNIGFSKNEIAELELNKIVKNTVSIYSPVSGVVVSIAKEEGAELKRGEVLLTLNSLSKIWVLADIYEKDLALIKKNQSAQVTFNSIPNKVFDGKVDFINTTINKKTNTVEARIIIENLENLIKPNMLADISISGDATAEVLAIPEYSILRSGRTNKVVVEIEKGKYIPQEIKLGRYSNGFYEVLHGITEESIVVTSGQFLIDSESNLSALYNNSKKETSTENLPDTTKIENEYGVESPMIRTGVIDLKSIDHNHDNHLFECPMDWNIISDEKGRCPVCEMKFKEYSIDKVKSNLDKYGYSYKK